MSLNTYGAVEDVAAALQALGGPKEAHDRMMRADVRSRAVLVMDGQASGARS